MHAHDENGSSIEIIIAAADIAKIVPLLLTAATVATRYRWPGSGTKISPGYVVVVQCATGEAKDTEDAFLRIHTDGGTLHLLFAPENAIACGKELQPARCRSSFRCEDGKAQLAMCDDPLDAQASVDWPVTLLPALQERINAWLANDFDAAIKETPAPATHNPIVAIEKDDVTIYDPIRNVSEVG